MSASLVWPARSPVRSPRVVLGLLLVVLGAALHAPHAARPFGPLEITGGVYVGVFAHNFAQLGFAALRGVPFGSQQLTKASEGVPYMNHPPGGAWLFAAAGVDEWQLRLPTIVGHVAGAVLLFVLLLDVLPLAAAWLAGLCLLVLPVLAFYGQVSYECLVLPVGLLLLLATSRILRTGDGTAQRSAWRVVQVASASIGPWLDWPFLFFVAALLPLTIRDGLRSSLRALVLPTAAVLASLAALALWWAWAQRLPELQRLEGIPITTLFGQTVLDRPPLWTFVRGFGAQLVAGFTPAVLVVGCLGLVVLARRTPRLTLALALAGALHPLVFAQHGMTHVHFVAYLAPLVAASVAAASTWLARRIRTVGVLLAVVVLAVAGAATRNDVAAASSPFFRDLGEVLSAASRERGRAVVVFNFPYCYGYYVDTPDVAMMPVVDPALLRAGRAHLPAGVGVRYLWLQFAGDAVDELPSLRTPPALAQHLEGLPRRRVPRLEQRLRFPGRSAELEVTEAWLVEL